MVVNNTPVICIRRETVATGKISRKTYSNAVWQYLSLSLTANIYFTLSLVPTLSLSCSLPPLFCTLQRTHIKQVQLENFLGPRCGRFLSEFLAHVCLAPLSLTLITLALFTNPHTPKHTLAQPTYFLVWAKKEQLNWSRSR